MSDRTSKMESLVDDINDVFGSLNPKIYYDVMNQIIELYEGGGKDELVSEAAEDLKAWENTKLNIAVTGETGAGKSSFINAIRGLKPTDEGAAPVGVTETTQKSCSYSHLNFPNVTFWDLPGIGTPRFPPEKYLERVNFSCYDFFIIICSKRFHSSNVHLAEEIQDMGKKFYFVRSKVDEDLINMQRSKSETYSEEQALEEMRDDCKQNLEKHLKNLSNPQIFLTSCWDLDKYDFPLLLETLEKDLPSLKSLAFLLSLPNISPTVIQKKKEALKKQLWKTALVSAFIKAVPFEDLKINFDDKLILKTITGFYKQFGLDDVSLAWLAGGLQKPVEELKAVIQSPLEKDIGSDVLLKLCASEGGPILSFVLHIKDHFASKEGKPPTVKESPPLTRLLTSPLGRSLVSGVLSFMVTYWILSKYLNKVAEDAERVSMKARELV